MAKMVKLDPLNQETAIATNNNLMSALLQNDLTVLQECGGRGMCSTCHVYIKEGMESLSALTRREQRTLEVITTCRTNSRLACQARVLGEGVVVELPTGMYVNAIEDIDSLVGKRAQQDILHPINGKVLVEAGKLITRTMISQLQDTRSNVGKLITQIEDV